MGFTLSRLLHFFGPFLQKGINLELINQWAFQIGHFMFQTKLSRHHSPIKHLLYRLHTTENPYINESVYESYITVILMFMIPRCDIFRLL